MRSPLLQRVVAVPATAGATLLTVATPALAQTPDAGSEPGEPLSPLATLLIFGVLPVALFLFIALLVSAGSIARGPRYRPDRMWDATPAEFGMPMHGVRPVPAGTAAAQLTEGAEAGAAGDAYGEAGRHPEAGETRPVEDDDPGGGGVSARW
ncbi:MAG: hypothetical protein L0Y54_13110 [Sporichthyaceae bacterium]|nr:hypothetical protein [Sporichthyaceae bacterium]